MAGCGKSSIGSMLAIHLNRAFLDTDELIATSLDTPLQDILDGKGTEYFKHIEEKILLSVNVSNHVVATGGSSIYSKRGIEHLRKDGTIILLEVDLDTLKQRVGDTSERGLVKQPDQSFEELYNERLPLYKKYAETHNAPNYLVYDSILAAMKRWNGRR